MIKDTVGTDSGALQELQDTGRVSGGSLTYGLLSSVLTHAKVARGVEGNEQRKLTRRL